MTDSTWNADRQLWQTIRPPLVPCAEDIRLLQAACPPALLAPDAAPRILVLGVTHALIDAPWPERSELHSVDYDPMMIEMFWKHPKGGRSTCAHWQDMPFPDDYFDLVIGDCSFNAIPAVSGYADILREVARVSRPGAPFITRFFMQSAPRLTLHSLPDFVTGAFSGLGSAAVRLLMVIAAADADGSLHFRDIAGKIADQCGDLDDYLVALGHDSAEIAHTRIVLQQALQLNYPSRAQIERAFAPWYANAEFTHPSYEVGRFCPLVRFF